MRIQNIFIAQSGLSVLLAIATLLAPWATEPASAGGFIRAGETNGVDLIMHPPGYTGSENAVTVDVCIDATSTVPAGASSLTEVEQSVRNSVAIWNQLQPIVGNALLSGDNNIPGTSVFYDFESVVLHEIGHCVGLAHVNAASESGLPSAYSNYTKATDGIDNMFNIMPGSDGVIGSKDDIRGDDVNLHWFRTDTNDPGELPLPVPVDSTTYDLDQTSLPLGHNFVANLDRDVAGTLGYPDTTTIRTEAVMQQGSYSDEDHRRLTADGVATVLLGMSGIDETAGTGDDYTMSLVYGGIKSDTTGCELVIKITGNGFASCSTSPYLIAPGHGGIAAGYMRFGAGFNWYLNQDGPCRQTLELVAGQWKQMALSCDPPAGSNTVAALLGDDLDDVYETDWVVYERDAVSDSYNRLELTDPMEVGRGYWIKTLNANQTIEIEGDFNVEADIPLESDASGRYNMVGHRYWYDQKWGDVLVIDPGNPLSPLTLDQADPDPDGPAGNPSACQGTDPLAKGCVMSREAHKWNGANHAAFNGMTAGMSDTLENFDGFWVKAFKSGISLRMPDKRSTPAAPHSKGARRPGDSLTKAGDGGWFVRLIAVSGNLRDEANVFGLLPGSVSGYDSHDLAELDPFGDTYLTIVFPHDDWGEKSGLYTSDYRGLSPRRDEVWHFEIHGSNTEKTVTLSWESSDDPSRFNNATLIDLETGQQVAMTPAGYTFELTGGTHRFRWIQNR